MYEGDLERYLRVGLGGLKAIEAVVAQVSPRSITSILDFPSGAGRVGRFLALRFPEAEITACDLDTEMVDFCAKVLRMTPVHSQVDFDKISFRRRFDLIWCGSLITHLDAGPIRSLLQFFHRHLKDNGLLIFTAHGYHVVDRIRSGYDYGRGQEAAAEAVRACDACGFAFIKGKEGDHPEYGISLTMPEWMRAQCATINGFKEVVFRPRGWDGHQDVYGFTKISGGSCGGAKDS
jgi:SAM-dependent methyltransferase